MAKHKLKILIILILFTIGISSFYFVNTKSSKLTKKEIKQNQIISYMGKFEDPNYNITKDFEDISGTGEISKLKESYEIGDFKETKNIIDNIIKNIPENSKLTTEQKTKKAVIKYLELQSVLNNGNYYYKEKEVQNEVKKITSEIEENDPEILDNIYGNYYLGYSQEIIKEYTGALNYYNKALSFASNDNKATTSIVLNQIGHIYDLQGDMNKAYEYYFKAYNMNKVNYPVALNIARYLTRIGEFDKAKKFYEYSLNTRNKPLRSEIYFSLSSVELELNGLKPNIDKSIEYAKLSINEFPDYPMGFVALARGYYMLNDKKYDKEIEQNLEKSIKLNPNNSYAYELLGLHIFDTNNIRNTYAILLNTQKIIDNDSILMVNQKIEYKINIGKLINFIVLFDKLINSDDFITNIKLLNNNGYDGIIKNQLKRNNNGIFGNKGIEIFNLYTN